MILQVEIIMYMAQLELMQNKPMIIMILILQPCIIVSEVKQHGTFITPHTALIVIEKIQYGYVRLSRTIWLINPYKIEIHMFFKELDRRPVVECMPIAYCFI